MGRPRKPTTLKVLDGDRKDRVNGSEPAAEPGIGEPPAWLDRHGRDAWERVSTHHRMGGLLTGLDAEAVALYCQSYSTYRHALASVTRHVAATAGKLADDEPDPEPEKPHPMMRVVNASHRQMVAILAKFGMTPSDRAGLHVRERPEEDDLLRFLARPEPQPPALPDAKPRRSRPKPR